VKDDNGRIANRRIIAREDQFAGRLVHLKDCDVVSSLITAVQEVSGRIKVKAARIIATCPFVGDVRQRTILTNGENTDAVMQTISSIDKLAIG
jgi:hypothetical protein